MNGTLITFYSFKGGVGRTQALANVAVALANRGHRVTVIDMDLESPGLHTFFFSRREATQRWSDGDMVQRPGLMDYVESCFEMPAEDPWRRDYLVPCHHPSLRGNGEIHLLPPGRLDSSYPHRITSFSWQEFYEERQGYRYMELLRRNLFEAGADFVLLDSRTGLTDVGMVCTFQLPDIVVMPFALHRQGIDGARRMVRAIQQRRQEGAPANRLRHVLLIPSRVHEGTELQALDMWLTDARTSLEGYGELLSGLDDRLPYIPRYAFGEHIVVAPDDELNQLSRAYERLAEKLAHLAGHSTPTQATEPQSFSLGELRASWTQLKERGEGFLKEARDFDLFKTRMEDLPRRVHDMVRTRRELLEGLQRMGQRMAHLSQGAGLEPSAHGGLDVALPETLVSIEALFPVYERVLSLLSRRVDEHKQLARKRLVKAADGDESQIDKAWRSIEPLFEDARLAEAERLLAPLEEALSRTTLAALLRRNALEAERLAQRYPSPEDRLSWLEDRLEQTVQLQEGAIEETKAILWNLLRLHLPLLKRPTQTHWAAYDIICLLVSDQATEDHRLFSEVGRGLWELEWTALLATPQALTDVDEPAGPEARQQLKRLELVPGMLDLVAACIVRGLVERWSTQGADETFAALFRKRGQEPSLRAAMLQLAAYEDLRPRRALIALWLQQAVDLVPERDLVLSFLETLVIDGLRAEAFFTAVAFSQRDRQLGQDERISSIQVGFALHLMSANRYSLLEGLFVDSGEPVGRGRPERGLRMMLAARLHSSRFAQREVESRLRRSLLYVERDPYVPVELRPWLEWLVRVAAVEEDDLSHVRKLLLSVNEISGVRFYASWVASQYYEADFRDLAQQLCARLFVEEAEVFIEQLNRLDAKSWADERHLYQRQRGFKTRYPEGQALNNLVKFFDEMRSCFAQLGELRRRVSGDIMRELLQSDQSRAAARESLLDWLRPQALDSQVDRALLAEMRALIEEAKA